jgi:hypothetical protein
MIRHLTIDVVGGYGYATGKLLPNKRSKVKELIHVIKKHRIGEQ